MTKVLITGGAGFIGSHLAEHLLALGQEVFVIDNLSTGSANNISHLRGNPNFHFIDGDIRDLQVLRAVITNVEAVYHLAASVGVKNIMANLVSSIENNIDGTKAVLSLAAEKGTRVLVVSTSEVYGKGDQRPSQETDDLRMGETIKTRWSYACSKALDEYMAFAYFHEKNLPVTVVRLFNTVGDRQTDAYGMVIPTFVKQALSGRPLTIYGDGQQTRCFIYVKDVVEALHGLMNRADTVGEVYNIGSTEVINIDELASRVLSLTGSHSLKQFIPYEQAFTKGFDDAERRQPNLDKIRQTIGFAPKHSLDDIIRTVIRHYQEQAATVDEPHSKQAF